MEKLSIVRTNPEQGRSVAVDFRSESGALIGKGEFPFGLWLQFEKLLKDAIEYRTRVETESPRISITFSVPVEETKPVEAQKALVSKIATTLVEEE